MLSSSSFSRLPCTSDTSCPWRKNVETSMVEFVTFVALVALTFVLAVVVVFRHAMSWLPSNRMWLVMPRTDSTRSHLFPRLFTDTSCLLLDFNRVHFHPLNCVSFFQTRRTLENATDLTFVCAPLQSTLFTLNAYTALTYCNKTTAASTDRIIIYAAVHIYYIRSKGNYKVFIYQDGCLC